MSHPTELEVINQVIRILPTQAIDVKVRYIEIQGEFELVLTEKYSNGEHFNARHFISDTLSIDSSEFKANVNQAWEKLNKGIIQARPH